MRDVAGLAETTRRQRRRIVCAAFLASVFGADGITVAIIGTSAVRRFVLGEGHGWSAGAVRVAGSSVGCYLNYRQMCETRSPSFASHPTGGELALSVTARDIVISPDCRALASFNASLPSGRRA